MRYYAAQVPRSFHHPVAGVAFAGAALFARADVAGERDRLDADGWDKHSAGAVAVDRHGFAYGRGKPGPQLSARAARRTGKEELHRDRAFPSSQPSRGKYSAIGPICGPGSSKVSGPATTFLTHVQVLQQDAHDNIVENYLAARADLSSRDKDVGAGASEGGPVRHRRKYHRRKNFILRSKIDQWTETPFRLGSANERAEYLSFPELREYLHFNSDFPIALLAPFRTHLHYRLALPWTCLVVVCIAAPLGIGYSRRGVLASVASAVVLVFSMNFLTHLFLALGEGDRISPLVAAWTPNLIFTDDRALLALFACDEPRSATLSTRDSATYICAMNPLPNEWAIKHRADTSAPRPSGRSSPGEYFYTLLFRDAEGFRREDLSEEGMDKLGTKTSSRFHFGKRVMSRCRKHPEPLAKENAEQLFRRLIASENPPANACYVLAAMLERKRVLKQIKTEERRQGPALDL